MDRNMAAAVLERGFFFAGTGDCRGAGTAGAVRDVADSPYMEIEIPPEEELRVLESSVELAAGAGEDMLPAALMLAECRRLAAAGRWDEYDDAVIAITKTCEEAGRRRGGRLRADGDYLGFFID